MITAPDLNSAGASPPPDGSLTGVGTAPNPALAPRPKYVWTAADLLLVGLVGALALGAAYVGYQQWEHRAARDHLVKDLTIAAAAFQTFMHDQGAVPADSNPGVVPPGVAPLLGPVDWTAPTPIGGMYRWVNTAVVDSSGTAPLVGRIVITAFPRTPPLAITTAELIEIDRQLDDGNLATGNFRTGFNGWPVLWVRAAP